MANGTSDEWPRLGHLHADSDSDAASSSERSMGEAGRDLSCYGVVRSRETTMSNTKKSRHRRAPPKAPPPPRQKATVKKLAEEKTSGPVNSDVEAQILARIRKCLDRANHPNTPEMEAKAALHMSSRLMAQHNVTQADVLAQATDLDQREYAGQSEVKIESTKDSFTRVICQTWVDDVVDAMELFFNCKSYSAARLYSVVWTFYGIAPNTVAAALAFEMAHNLILEWARGKKGATNSYCLGVAQGLRQVAKEDKRREEHEARAQEREILATRLKEEQLARQKELDRLNNDTGTLESDEVTYAVNVADDSVTSNEASPNYDFADHDDSSSDPDDDMARSTFNDQFEEATEAEPTFIEENTAPLDLEADFEVELQRILKRERSCIPLTKIKSETSASQTNLEEMVMDIKSKLDEDVKPKLEEDINPKIEKDINPKLEKEHKPKLEAKEDKPRTENSLWTSASQLILFRTTANKIADEYLKSTGMKLGKGRARVSSVRDYGAYEQGRKDSHKIDVKRRRIE